MTYPQQPTPQQPRYAGPPQPAYLPGQPAGPQPANATPGIPPGPAAPTYPAGPGDTTWQGYPPAPNGYMQPPVLQGPGKKPGKAKWIIGVAAVVLALAGGRIADYAMAHPQAKSADQVAIEAVTTEEFKAAENGDVATALKDTSGAVHDSIAATGLPANSQGVNMTSIQVTDLKITGNTATAEVTLSGTVAAEGGRHDGAVATYTYQKVNGDWTIYDTELHRNH